MHGRWKDAKLCLFYSSTLLNMTLQEDFSWEPIDFQFRGQVQEGSDEDICRALPPPSSDSPLELHLARPLDLQALFLAPIDSSCSLRWHGGQLEEKVRKLQTSCVLELEEVEVLSS